jgi:hypothetical protein
MITMFIVKEVAGVTGKRASTWAQGEVALLRAHIQLRLHKAGFSRESLAKGYALKVCSADNCSRISIIPRELMMHAIASSKDSSQIDWDNRRQDHASHIRLTQGLPAGLGFGLLGAPHHLSSQNVLSSLPLYLVDAPLVFNGMSLDDIQLAPCSVMMKFFGSTINATRAGLETIISDILRGIMLPELIGPTKEAIWKLLSALPRFLFFAPNKNQESKPVRGLTNRVWLFLDGQAHMLPKMSNDFRSVTMRYDLTSDDTTNAIMKDEETGKEKRKWFRVDMLIQSGEYAKAANSANPD